MMKKNFSSIMKITVCVLLVMFLFAAISCKKASSPPPPKEPEQEPQTKISTAETGDTETKTPEVPPLTPAPTAAPSAPAKETETPEEAEAPKEKETPKEAEEPKEANAPELVPLEIPLPKPMFVGTPLDARVSNLEQPRTGPRPPFLVPVGTKNVALEKPVTSTDEEPIIGDIEMITDGDMEAADGSYVELGPDVQHVTIDLEAMHEIYAIVIWHYHKQAWVYFDVVVQLADDSDFITNVRTLFNNDTDNSSGLGAGENMNYTETNEGKLLDAKGERARYVRLYSNGNSANDLNHYIEVAVYGKPID